MRLFKVSASFAFVVLLSVSAHTSPYHYKTLKQWTLDCLTLFPEYLCKGSWNYAKDPETLKQQKNFYKHLHTDLKSVFDLYMNESQHLLTNRDLWLDPAQAFAIDNSIFDQDTSLTKKVAGPDGKDMVKHDVFVHPFTQKIIIDSGSTISIMGDIHGSLHSLLRCLWYMLSLGYIDNNFNLTKDNFYMVFNGDFVNRGNYGCEVVYTLLRLKAANLDRVFLVRGNHEDAIIQDKVQEEGLPFEIDKKYKDKTERQVLKDVLNKAFELMPLSLFISCNGDTVQSCHGGIEPGYSPREFIQSDKMFNAVQKKVMPVIAELEKRFLFYPNKTNNFKGLNWSDFTQTTSRDVAAEEFDAFLQEKKIDELTLDFPYRACLGNVFRHPTRSSGYLCNVYAVKNYLAFNDLKSFIRSHQDKGFGCKMLFDPNLQKDKLDKTGAPKKGVIKDFGSIRYASGKRKDPGYHDGPFHWTDVVSQEDAEKKEGFLMSDYYPVFVFSSAPEGRGLPHDCFSILKTADSYEKWRLRPYEMSLVDERNDKYVHLKRKDAGNKYVHIQIMDKLNIRFSHHEKPVNGKLLEASLDSIIAQSGGIIDKPANQLGILDWIMHSIQDTYGWVRSLFS